MVRVEMEEDEGRSCMRPSTPWTLSPRLQPGRRANHALATPWTLQARGERAWGRPSAGVQGRAGVGATGIDGQHDDWATPRAKGWRTTAELAKDAESEEIEERENM
jgi:hypothetical protein